MRPSGQPAGTFMLPTFSPDGRYLLTTSMAGDLTLRDPETFEPVRTFRGDTGTANAIGGGPAFSDDGRYVVTAFDGKARLWEVESGQLIGKPIDTMAQRRPRRWPARTPASSAWWKEWVQLWRFAPEEWASLACRMAGRNLTADEWRDFGPRDRPYRATCPQWAAAA